MEEERDEPDYGLPAFGEGGWPLFQSDDEENESPLALIMPSWWQILLAAGIVAAFLWFAYLGAAAAFRYILESLPRPRPALRIGIGTLGTMSIVLLMGLTLYWLRTHQRLLYGSFELAVAFVSAGVTSTAVVSSSAAGAQTVIAVMASVYFMVRALVNIEEGRAIRERKRSRLENAEGTRGDFEMTS